MDNIIRVCIVAGFEPLRLGLVKTLGGSPDIEIIGETTSLGDMIANAALRDADGVVVDVDALGGAAPGTVGQRNEGLPALKGLVEGKQEHAREDRPDRAPE